MSDYNEHITDAETAIEAVRNAHPHPPVELMRQALDVTRWTKESGGCHAYFVRVLGSAVRRCSIQLLPHYHDCLRTYDGTERHLLFRILLRANELVRLLFHRCFESAN